MNLRWSCRETSRGEKGKKILRAGTADTQNKGKTGLTIAVVGRLLKYLRLDYIISSFEAIWQKEHEQEKDKGREGDQKATRLPRST